MVPFYGMDSTDSRLEPFEGGSWSCPFNNAKKLPIGHANSRKKKSIEKVIVNLVILIYLQSSKLPLILLVERSNLKYYSSYK